MQVDNESSVAKWEEFLRGDENAYSWLYKAYVQLLYNYGSHFTMDRELIKDCIQEVFTKIYKNRKTLSLPDNVRVYLLISLKNSILNALDKQHRYTDLESIPFMLSETVEDKFLSEEAAKLQKEEVENILSILTPRQREIMYYRFVEELDFEQICKIMDLNYNSAHNLIQRALKKIRDNYDSVLFYLYILSYFSKHPFI